MKIALVHDQLAVFGGQERVLQSLLKLFPDADVYTSFSNPTIIKQYFPNLRTDQLHHSIIHNAFFTNHKSLFQVFSPLIWKSFNLEKYDLVLSLSSNMLSNLIQTKKPIHIQYISTPPKNLFGLEPLRPLQHFIPYTRIIGTLYKIAIKSSPYIIVNSQHIRKMIYQISGVLPQVIYPPVRIPTNIPQKTSNKYFLIVSRLDPSKNIELAIKTCNVLKLPLVIVGKAIKASYEKYLKSIAGPTVEFLGEKSDMEIDILYKSVRAFIFTAINEDFGIAPVEAMAHGVPIISYYGGGLKETNINNKTGIFFYKNNVNSLIEAIKILSKIEFNPLYLYTHSKKFGENIFLSKINKVIEEILNRSSFF